MPPCGRIVWRSMKPIKMTRPKWYLLTWWQSLQIKWDGRVFRYDWCKIESPRRHIIVSPYQIFGTIEVRLNHPKDISLYHRPTPSAYHPRIKWQSFGFFNRSSIVTKHHQRWYIMTQDVLSSYFFSEDNSIEVCRRSSNIEKKSQRAAKGRRGRNIIGEMSCSHASGRCHMWLRTKESESRRVVFCSTLLSLNRTSFQRTLMNIRNYFTAQLSI